MYIYLLDTVNHVGYAVYICVIFNNINCYLRILRKIIIARTYLSFYFKTRNKKRYLIC